MYKVVGKIHHRWTEGYLGVDGYAARHSLKVKLAGLLAQILLPEKMYLINSSHAQAGHKLGHSLHVEGVAKDGVIEAISVTDALGVCRGTRSGNGCTDTWPNKQIFTAFPRVVFTYHEKRIN
ncbi:MAG: gamma-glutamyl-gamma-aminobutyrate hydrolase family protein [Alphaproteobacteria bacterium]|nr:gamma-glutamyl-gamma-aminobutyrate hydrolase family protein [Alphaproteobacteria bacterium]